MKRLLAILLACILGAGSFASAEETGVFSYDFDLQFRLNPAVFPTFQARQHMKGYADLLELLEFRGNFSWCPETESTDLRIDLVPRTRKESAVSLRIYGTPEVQRVTSPLMGKEAACFYPDDVMRPALAIRQTFGLPLPELLLMNPMTTVDAFRCLADDWSKRAGDAGTKGGAISISKLKKIAAAWRSKLERNFALTNWKQAVFGMLGDGGKAESDLDALPDLLLSVAGGKALKVKISKGVTTYTNAKKFVLWQEKRDGTGVEYALNVPPEGLEYVPSFRMARHEADGKVSFGMDLRWDPAKKTEDAEGPRLGLHAEAEGLPAALPAASAFTAALSQDGWMVPAFSFLLQGSTAEDGRISLSLSLKDRPEAGAALTAEGTLRPAVREEPLAYNKEEIATEYNLFTLSYSTQHDFIDRVKRPVLLGLIDFLYELPASSCQSIMDDLDAYGILRTALE